jgi:transposase
VASLAREENVLLLAQLNFLATVTRAELRPEIRTTIDPLVSALQRICVELARTNQRLEELARQEPTIEKLTTAPSVGLVVATAFVSVVDEARRFQRAHQLESYLGLVPREASTGGKRKLGSITKPGISYMRQLLVQSASGILRVGQADDPLRQWGHELVARRGRKIAVVALARRLAGNPLGHVAKGDRLRAQALGSAVAL